MDKVYDCEKCIHYFDCPGLGNIDACPEARADRVEEEIAQKICSNPKCNHWLVGNDRHCPNQACKYYGVGMVVT
jgi:hypothetical protein